jgi:hypothetical protein
MGDCFLITSVGELALQHSKAIKNMIHTNSDGTETVTLYTDPSGNLPTFNTTAFKATTVNVDNVFPTYAVNGGATQDVVNGQKEIWPQILENAVAQISGGYDALANGGWPMIVMEQLTGHQASWMLPGALTASLLNSFSTAGDLIAMDTNSESGLPYGLVSGHAYMFEKLTVVSGTAMVQLGNPWGFDQPSAIPLASLPQAFSDIEVGRFA